MPWSPVPNKSKLVGSDVTVSERKVSGEVPKENVAPVELLDMYVRNARNLKKRLFSDTCERTDPPEVFSGLPSEDAQAAIG